MRHLSADYIDRVAKPARYLGGEYQSLTKDHADARVCLAFPDVYDIGMSHQRGRDVISADRQRRRIARNENPGQDSVSSIRSILAPLSRPIGCPSTRAAGPVAQRPRQNTGSSVTAPSAVV